MRDDFTDEVKRILAARVGNVCSNPDCRAPTSGPQNDATKALNVGVAAHITSAAEGGPRYNPLLCSEERRHPDNGIWLCQTCAKLIDNDSLRFTEKLIRAWKEVGEYRALNTIGKTATDQTRTAKQSNERKREAELVIHPGARSKYIAVRGRDQYPLPLKGLHIELDLSVENKGGRNSTVNRYTLTLPDFGKSFSDVKPYFTQMVQGRHSNYALDAKQFYPPGEFIRIQAESVVGPAFLAFFVSDLPLDSFGTRAFDGNRETRIFPPIRCELVLADTEGFSAKCEFALNEFK